MTGYSISSVRVEDPYAFLALAVLRQAFKDIEAYYTGKGTDTDILEGRKSVKWVRRMDKTFILFAGAAHLPINHFHQVCLKQINAIAKEAYERRCIQE